MTQGNVAGGHKANINNPNTSDESKENSKQALQNMDEGGSEYVEGQPEGRELSDNNYSGSSSRKSDDEKNENNVIGGHKATLNNPRVGEEAKEHSKEVLKEHGVEV